MKASMEDEDEAPQLMQQAQPKVGGAGGLMSARGGKPNPFADADEQDQKVG